MFLNETIMDNYYKIESIDLIDKSKKHLIDMGVSIGTIIKILKQTSGGTIIVYNNVRLAVDLDIAKGITVGDFKE